MLKTNLTIILSFLLISCFPHVDDTVARCHTYCNYVEHCSSFVEELISYYDFCIQMCDSYNLPGFSGEMNYAKLDCTKLTNCEEFYQCMVDNTDLGEDGDIE